MKKKFIFKPIAILLVIAGFFTFAASVDIFILKSTAAYGTLAGVVIILGYFILAGLEISLFRSVYRTEVGSWKGIFNTLVMAVLARAFLVWTNWNVLQSPSFRVDYSDILKALETSDAFLFFVLNIFFLAVEVLAIVLMMTSKELFMPTEEEKAAALRRFGGQMVKTVSECPSCHALIEKDWILCPECGKTLPRTCAKCGTALVGMVAKCPNCGAEVANLEALRHSISTLKKIAEEEAKPEARSVRYARLAEEYLKAGDLEDAIETYKKAIHFTEFTRKQSNFMVKMATVLQSAGRDSEAFQILDAALELDPEDAAGAKAMKMQLEAHGIYLEAKKEHEARNDADALAKLEKAIELDPQDVHGEKALKGEIEALALIEKAKEAVQGGKNDQAVQLLEQAVKADVGKKTTASAELGKLAPKGRKKKT
ncbi:MAG: zinc ribbon domain-containing protein [Methanomassiliicoccales archaeon]|nr:zinc ribbon domain-containing protein [Methanomassiliicoccales archaeon]